MPCRHFGRESLGLGQSGQAGDVFLGPGTLRDRRRALRVTTVQKRVVPGICKLLGRRETKTVRRSGDQNRRLVQPSRAGDGPAPRWAPGQVVI
ncbi:hypothetical protein ACE1SV_64290 [Streptomyces sennicomposti]